MCIPLRGGFWYLVEEHVVKNNYYPGRPGGRVGGPVPMAAVARSQAGPREPGLCLGTCCVRPPSPLRSFAALLHGSPLGQTTPDNSLLQMTVLPGGRRRWSQRRRCTVILPPEILRASRAGRSAVGGSEVLKRCSAFCRRRVDRACGFVFGRGACARGWNETRRSSGGPESALSLAVHHHS